MSISVDKYRISGTYTLLPFIELQKNGIKIVNKKVACSYLQKIDLNGIFIPERH